MDLDKVLNLIGVFIQASSLLLLIRPFSEAKALLGSNAHRKLDGGNPDQTSQEPDLGDVLEVFLKEKSNPRLFIVLTLASLLFQGLGIVVS